MTIGDVEGRNSFLDRTIWLSLILEHAEMTTNRRLGQGLSQTANYTVEGSEGLAGLWS